MVNEAKKVKLYRRKKIAKLSEVILPILPPGPPVDYVARPRPRFEPGKLKVDREPEQPEQNEPEQLEIPEFKGLKSPFKRWSKVSDDPIFKAGQFGNVLGQDALRVLLGILGRVEYNNFVKISQSQLARDYKMHQSAVARAFKKLCDIDLLIKGDADGSLRGYRLNPHFAWRGSNEDHIKALKTAPPLRIVSPLGIEGMKIKVLDDEDMTAIRAKQKAAKSKRETGDMFKKNAEAELETTT